ncbi:flagellar biosynthesis anti-sigma factor FlgM [Anoxybacteroides amylolyticum]|uniref:Negative regulator of flagellin synthesis n=1 Tax=Anoxybacteroides amylolyticum TaxID=294699 RepID=A0A167T4T3_9BACL|nr:flagellar biosynthesis anti-sigma factor FlgM [Anoxybacillus amylolyticus]ANB59450.1 flagellar biosynthesis anti-sigma factor FlgM [Anoxybacillus amylolyticus]
MRIHNFYSTKIDPYKLYPNKASVNDKSNPKKDQVEISEEAKELQQNSSWMLERQNKVQALKEQVQSGSYKVDAYAVAKSVYDFYFNK